jgi:ABC-type sugar transport system substrate-binding protein
MRSTIKRQRFRRLAAVGIAVLVTAAAASCGGSSSSSSSNSAGSGSSSSAKTVHLAFIYPGTFANFAQEMALGAKAAADHTPGVDFTESAPANNDGNQQVQLFQDATQTSKDGMAWMTLFPQLFIRPVQQATSQNIPLIAVDVPPPQGTKVTTFVGNSNTELGQAANLQLLQRRSDPDRHRHAGPAASRGPKRRVLAGHQGPLPEGAADQLRLQANPDRQLQRVERGRQGAPQRAGLRRPW